MKIDYQKVLEIAEEHRQYWIERFKEEPTAEHMEYWLLAEDTIKNCMKKLEGENK